MSDLPFRPRSATEIVDGTFRLYREHFVSFLTLSTLVYLPIIALMIPLLRTMSGPPEGMVEGFAAMGTWVIALMVVSLLWYPLMWSALMISASERYLGRHIEAGEAIRRAFGKFGTLLACWLAKWLILILGLFLLLVPWFYFIARYFAVPATTLFVNRGVGESFRRSSQLSIGQKGRILGTLLLAWAIVFGISFAVSMVVSIILVATVATRGVDAMSGSSSLLAQIPNMFAYILGLPIIVITQTLLYYDLRIRQEGYDIELMSAQLGEAGTEVAAH